MSEIGKKIYDFDGIVLRAIESKASDVHFETGIPPYFRIDGSVLNSNYSKINMSMINDIKSIVLQGRDDLLRKLDKEGQIDCSYNIRAKNGKLLARLRVSFAKCIEGMKCVCRIIPIKIPTIDGYGMPRIFKNISSELTGMVVISGVTGSGKSTTIAAMLDYINKTQQANVVTIEDPVEFLHKSKKSIFTHREIGLHTISFSEALRTTLRQDPDVILIGEMRDLESIRYGIAAAETGHLVFATVHSETVPDIPERIISTFPEREQDQIRYQVADCALAFISQKLIKKKSGKGRAAAFEILVFNSASRNIIRQKKSYELESIMQTQTQNGCITMTKSLINLYESGVISDQDLIRYSPNKSRAREYVLEHTDGELDIEEPTFWKKFM